MDSPRLRYLLSKAYFPAAFLIAIVLAILDLTMAPAHGQVRTVTVTVYLTVVHTVPIYVPVTAYVTVASVATSFVTLTNTAVSLGTVTIWNTVSFWSTVTTTSLSIPTYVPEGETLANVRPLLAAAGGIAVGFASSIAATRMKYRRLVPRLDGRLIARLDESLVEAAHLAAELEGIGERLKGPLADSATERSMWKRLHPELDFEFENFDQKANQLFNILSTVLRIMKEMQQGVVRNFP